MTAQGAANLEPVAWRKLGEDGTWTLFYTNIGWKDPTGFEALYTAAPAPVAQETTGCACRWDADDNRVATCERHQGWLDVVHEWAERAKVAEAALQSTSPVATHGDFKEWVSRAYREPHSTFTIHNMEVAFAAGKQHEQANHTRAEAIIPKEVMGMINEIKARYFQNQLECMDFRDKNFWAAGQTALVELEQKLKERFGPIA